MPVIPYATLFDVVLRLARELVLVRDGVATGGTTLSLVDTLASYPQDTFRGGTLFLPATSVYKVISQQDANSFTFAGAVAAITAGTAYAVADNDIPLDVLISSINSAIRAMVLVGEDVTVVTVSGQDEYTLPANVSGVLKVEPASSATSPYGFATHQHWDEVDGKIRFSKSRPGTDGYPMRLTFIRKHTDLSVAATTIPTGINLNYLHWCAVEVAAKYGLRVHHEDKKRDWPAKIQEAEVRVQRFASQQPKPQQTPRLADW